jgi:TetR/AcrR family transcriptional regulator
MRQRRHVTRLESYSKVDYALLMGRPRRQSTTVSTAEQLRLAAEHEFAARGFAGARLEDIAARVGVTRPSLLHHYPTKESLYDAVVADLITRLRASLIMGMTSEGGFVDRLSATVGRFADHLYDNPVPTQLLVRELQDAQGHGEQLIREQVVPLLELAESFIQQFGRDVVPSRLDVRAALLDLIGAVVFYAIAGPARHTLWGTTAQPERDRTTLREHFISLARHLLLSPAPLPRSPLALGAS